MASFYRREVSDIKKTELQRKNPSESKKILMPHEIRPYVLT